MYANSLDEDHISVGNFIAAQQTLLVSSSEEGTVSLWEKQL
jgi:hypothetical protein